MEATTTLRKLITKGVKQALHRESLLPSELIRIVDHIINNSFAICHEGTTNLTVKSGNSIGLSSETANKTIPTPRFICFEFGISPVLQTMVERSYQSSPSYERSWVLQSFATFEQLADYVAVQVDDEKKHQLAVLVDGEPAEHRMLMYRDYSALTWGFDVYKLTFEQDTEVIEEMYRCKPMLEHRLMQIVQEGAKGIVIRNLIEDEVMHFRAQGTLYSTVVADAGKLTPYIAWTSPALEAGWNYIPCEEDGEF